MKKKIISLIMACAMVITSMPGTALAAEQVVNKSGTAPVEIEKNIAEENSEIQDPAENPDGTADSENLEDQNLHQDSNQENGPMDTDSSKGDETVNKPVIPQAEYGEKLEQKPTIMSERKENQPKTAKNKPATKPSNHPPEEKGVLINTKNFDDKCFREYVKQFDENKDGKLSEKERNSVKYMNLNSESLHNLHGIGWFKGLEVLNIAECRNIKSYNATNNPNLRELICWEATNLKTITISKNTKMEKLDCSYSAVEKLDLTKNAKLTNLNVAGCKITTLNMSKNTKLENLDVSDNQLKTLSLKNNSDLKQMSCWNNPNLKTIDVTACKNLEILDCSECVNLEKLDVTQCGKLKRLECWSDYKLKTINLTKNPALEYLDCSYNEIKNLNLSKNKELKDLNCEQCALTALNLSYNNKLENIKTEGNMLRVDLPIVLFDVLSTNFDPARVSHVTGGVMEKINGSYKDFRFVNSDTITYNYKLREGLTEKFTIKTTFNIKHEKPASVNSLAIYPDYGMIKAVCPVNKQEGATYRFACRKSGTKTWHYYNRDTNEIVIKNLEKNVLYDIAAANVLGDDHSAFKQKRIYTNRVGNYEDPMEKNNIEKLTTTKGKISVTSKKISYTTNPKVVKYRFAYKIKGTDTWTFVKTSNTHVNIDKLKSGKTYTVAVGHYYVSPLDNKTTVYSNLSKYKYIKVK